MCTASPPKPVAPLPPTAPPMSPVLTTSTDDPTAKALQAAKGRNSLRIDRTAPPLAAIGSGLNIPG